jgi:hypothetical protein
VIVFMTELPLASTNKVDRKALAAIARERWLVAKRPNH